MISLAGLKTMEEAWDTNRIVDDGGLPRNFESGDQKLSVPRNAYLNLTLDSNKVCKDLV